MNKPPPKLVQFLFPTFGNMLWMSAFFYVIISGRRMMNGDGDLGFHLTLGRYILNNRTIPLQDLFSHTMTGEPVTQHEWLTTVIFAGLERHFGFDGIILFSAIIIATAFWVVFLRSQSKGSLLAAISVGFLSMLSSILHWLTRPHIVTFLLLGLWIFLLDQMRRGKHKIWWLFPVIMLLWTNLHGAFIVGFITWIIYGIGVGWDVLWKRFPEKEPLPLQFWWSYLLAGISSWVFSLINPSGFGLWVKVVTHIGNRYLASRTIEFQSPNFHWSSTWPFLFFILLLIFVLAFSEKKYHSEHVFNAMAWLALGLYGARNIPLFAIVAAPLLVQGMDDVISKSSARFKFLQKLQPRIDAIQSLDRQLKGFFWPVLSVLVVITGIMLGFRFTKDGESYTFDPETFPVAAVNWLEENPLQGEMFNYYTWGGYLQYRLWPEKKVFIDGKADFYGEDYVKKYAQVIEIDGDWEKVFEEYSVDWVILPPDLPIVHILQCQPSWKKVYEDNIAVIFAEE